MGSSKQVRVTSFKVKAISALMVSVWGLPTFALELGRLQLQSAIGEPLRAEIEIAKLLPEELKSLRVQLASPESFRKVGMEFNPGSWNSGHVVVKERNAHLLLVTLNKRGRAADLRYHDH